jgi:NIPSNAP
MVEILILNLKPGTRQRFHKIYTEESLPLQKKWNIEVVANGPCLYDENGYWVIRSFKSLMHRQKSEDAFYASDDWQNGPRTLILELIESSAYMVVSPDSIKEWVSRL